MISESKIEGVAFNYRIKTIEKITVIKKLLILLKIIGILKN